MKTAVKDKVSARTPWRTLDGQIMEVVINPAMTVREQYQAACRIARLPYERRAVERTLAGLSSEFYRRYAYTGLRPTRDGIRPWIERQNRQQAKRYHLISASPKCWVKVRRYTSDEPLRIYGYLVGMGELEEALVGHDFDDDSDQILTANDALDFFNCNEFRSLGKYEEK